MTTALVRYEPPLGDTLFARRGLLLDLRRKLRALEDEYNAEAAALQQFERRYKPAVGARYDELERLRGKIDRAWDALRRGRAPQAESAPPEEPETDIFRPGGELRRLFRALARRIHPDLAADDEDRVRRHEFMAEATLAYRANDARRLQWLLEHWEAQRSSISGNDPHALLSRTDRQIAWTRYRVREMHAAIGELHASSLAEIKREAEAARGMGRNLILELRKRVSSEIDAARRELERVRQALADLDPELLRMVEENQV